MNQGMFSEIKALLGELTKRFDKLIELVESQTTQQSPQVARDEAEDKPKVQPPQTNPAPVEAELMTHDGERTIVKAPVVERRATQVPTYTPTYAPAERSETSAPAQKASKSDDKGYSGSLGSKRQRE